MNCLYPYFLKSQNIFVPCGKCINCLYSKKKEWSLRLSLELSDKVAYFGTLTYAVFKELNKKDIQLFLKSIRRSLDYHYSINKVRYFASGEHGDITNRPHYHFLIWAYQLPNLKDFHNLVFDKWSKGIINVQPITSEGAVNYVCGYVLKKQKDKPFIMMSRRPGIGYEQLYQQVDLIVKRGFISHNGVMYSIPATLKRKLFEEYPELKEKYVNFAIENEPETYNEIREEFKRREAIAETRKSKMRLFIKEDSI